MRNLWPMRFFSRFSLCVLGSMCLAAPAMAQPFPDNPLRPASVNALDGSRLAAAETAVVEPQQVMAAADLRLASLWLGRAFNIPARVPEELFYAGHTYADAIIALSLMDQGASLNEILELRAHNRWIEVIKSVDVGPERLPRIVRRMIKNDQAGPAPEALRFVPDVRSSLNDRLRLPRFAATMPDRVSVDRFRLSKKEVSNVRLVFSRMDDLTPELLRLPAGRSLITADWVIAATLAKYQPFPVETILAMRTGEVVEWGDVASLFGTDPTVFVNGPLAPIYAVLTGTADNCILPTFRRESYPEAADVRYNFSNLSATEEDALNWLMGMYFKANAHEADLLAARSLPLAERSLALAVARFAQVPLNEVLDLCDSRIPWDSVVAHYNLDLTGEEVIAQMITLLSPAKPVAPIPSVTGSSVVLAQ